MSKRSYIDALLDRRKGCALCDNPLPEKPDYINETIPICKECGDVFDALNTLKTGDDSWLRQKN